jgi:hypothetical protein
MRKGKTIALFLVAAAIAATAGSKIEGTATLKDFQPFGTTDKKRPIRISSMIFPLLHWANSTPAARSRRSL